MNLTNYHSHSNFCDGKAPLEDFVKSAIAAGFTAYGVSSHAPLPFSTRWTMEKEQVPDYLREIERLKGKYAGQIELYAGMEIDYLDEKSNPANDYFQHLPLDYRIGSVHLVYTEKGEVIDTDTNPDNFQLLLQQHFAGDLQRMVRCYYEASMRMVEKGGFDFIGHADKIAYNAEFCQSGSTESVWYSKMRNELFDLIAEKGVIMEINTKAWLKKNCFFPMQRYWADILKRHIPVVVNSDVHLPELVNAGRPEALKQLKDIGFTTICEFHHGVWQEVGIQ